MANFFEELLPFEQYTLKSEKSKAKIMVRALSVNDDVLGHYKCYALNNGFLMAQKRALFPGSKSDIAPVARAVIEEREDGSVIYVNVHMRSLANFLLVAIYFCSMAVFGGGLIATVINAINAIIGAGADFSNAWMLLIYPCVQLLVFVAFKMPAKRLKKLLEQLVA